MHPVLEVRFLEVVLEVHEPREFEHPTARLVPVIHASERTTTGPGFIANRTEDVERLTEQHDAEADATETDVTRDAHDQELLATVGPADAGHSGECVAGEREQRVLLRRQRWPQSTDRGLDGELPRPRVNVVPTQSIPGGACRVSAGEAL